MNRDSKMFDYGTGLTAMILVWGATAYNYINTGFSIAMIVFALYFVWSRARKEPMPRWKLNRRMLIAFAVLYGALFFSTLFHLDSMKNLNGGYFSAVGFVLYTLPLWMLLYTGGIRDIRKAVCTMFFLFLYAMCVFGIIKYFWLGEGRLSSFYTFPTRIGMMLDMFIPFTAAFLIYYRENRRFRNLAVLLLVLEAVTYMLAKVRGSFLAFSAAAAVTGLLWLYMNRDRVSARVRNILLIGGAFGIAVILSYGLWIHWGNMAAMMGGERFLMWESSFRMWADHPLTGIGLNAWQAAYASGPYHPAISREAGQIMPHNVFIYFFATAGTIGGLAYLAYCFLMGAYLLDTVRKQSRNPFSWALLFMFLAATAHGLVDQTFILKLTGRIFYMLLGVGILFLKKYPDELRQGAGEGTSVSISNHKIMNEENQV